jgi:carboxypeptidase family protein
MRFTAKPRRSFLSSWCTTTLATASAALVAVSCANSGHIGGRVTQLEDGALAGAKVTIDGLKRHEEARTDSMGRFDFLEVAPGPYRLTAESTGFETETREDVRMTRGATATVDFVLHPACVEEGAYADQGLTWALRAAEAILYVRIVDASPPDRFIVDRLCVVGIDHAATVLSILNMSKDSASIPRTIHIVKDGRTPLPGEEYIAFLRWEPAIGSYRPIAGPIFMVPVSAGKVAWARTDAPGIRDGEAPDKVLASLYALLLPARAAQ